jgi:hypothetical protein
MNIKESIRRILREDKQLIPMIRRRIQHDDLEREFSESLISARDMFSYSENRGQTMTRTQFTNGVVSRMIDRIHYEIHSTMPDDSQWYDNVYDSLKDYYKDKINNYYDNLIGKVLEESRFFHRRINLDDLEKILPINAQQVYYETGSYEGFKYDLTLRAVEAIMWNNYELGWEDLPEQEEINFVTEISNMFEDKIKALYNYYNKK